MTNPHPPSARSQFRKKFNVSHQRFLKGILTVCSLLFPSLEICRAEGSQNAPHPLWAVKAGSPYYATSEGCGTDRHGNLYVTGRFREGVSIGGQTLHHPTDGTRTDFFLAKLDASGQCLWLKGGEVTIEGFTPYVEFLTLSKNVVVGADDSLYLAGIFHRKLVLGTNILTSEGEFAGFLAKFSASGENQWTLKLGDPLESPLDIAPALGGGVEIAGTLFADTEIGGQSVKTGKSSRLYVANFHPSGTLRWLRSFGGDGLAYARGIATDSDGNCFLPVDYYGPIEFGSFRLPGHPEYSPDFPYYYGAMGLVKLASNGDTMWASQLPVKTDVGRFYGVAADAAGNAFCTGELFESYRVNEALYNRNSRILVAKYNAEGELQWNRQVGGEPSANSGAHAGLSIISDDQSGCYVAGNFGQKADFGLATLSERAHGFLAHFHTDGGLDWARSIADEGNAVTSANLITRASTGDFVVSGLFGDTGQTADLQTLNLGGHLLTTPPATTAMFIAQFPASTPRPPVIDSSPGELTAAPYSPLNLAVLASGTPPLHYQWRHNSSNLLLADLPTLTIASAAPEDEGDYSVVVSNSFGSVTGMVARVSVGWSLTLSANGAGTVSALPEQNAYKPLTSVLVTATPHRWHRFAKWEDGSPENPRVVIMDTNRSLVAQFMPAEGLELVTVHGAKRYAPPGVPYALVDGMLITNGVCLCVEHAPIELRTTFPGGLIQYTVDGSIPSLDSPVYRGPLIIRKPTILHAMAWNSDFSRSTETELIRIEIQPAHPLDLLIPGGGTILQEPDGNRFIESTSVDVEAVPAEGWSFLGWLGSRESANPMLHLTMTNPVCLRAVFGTTLEARSSGAGRVDIYPSTGPIPYGHPVVATAIPEPGHYFALWGHDMQSQKNGLVFSVTNARPNITALFSPLPPGEFSLTIQSDGFGHADTLRPVYHYKAGSIVSVFAKPDPDQDFLGWSGDAEEAQPQIVLHMDRSLSVKASFSRKPRLLPADCPDSTGDGKFTVLLRGELGATYQIQTANESSQWVPLMEVWNRYGECQFQSPFSSQEGLRFYRAVRVGP